ncbi:hypothetical protein BC829DRAFT_383428 [Chytridium lagenaria]|nr:hypothetical protein BC829DRAFT_383428 [Chytridium lagenaria]
MPCESESSQTATTLAPKFVNSFKDYLVHLLSPENSNPCEKTSTKDPCIDDDSAHQVSPSAAQSILATMLLFSILSLATLIAASSGLLPNILPPVAAADPAIIPTTDSQPQTTPPTPPPFLLLLSLLLIVILGILGGRVAERLKQAPMIGMLLAGVLARNLLPSIILPLPHSWTAQLWTISLAAVVSRSGLSLQIPTIRPNLGATVLLGSVPVLVESVFLAGLVRWVFGLPTEWSFTLAFGVASISPGVVVPLLLNLLELPTWHGSRLPPLLLAATGLDVLIATTCFGVSVAAVFGHSHESSDAFHASWLARGLEEVFLGIGGGVFVGALGFFLRRVRFTEGIATGVMFVVSTAGMMYLKMHGFPGAASASVILAWAVVANVWEKETVDMANKRLKLVWKFSEPFLFPLIGASVSFTEIRFHIILLSLMCISLSILSLPEEQIFTCGLFTGKASVQAALSTVTMEAVHRYNLQGTKDDARSRIVFACMVCAILLGAPFAASWVSVFGSRAPNPSRGILGQIEKE